MIDYSDWRVWKEVELYGSSEYLGSETEYHPDSLLGIFSSLLEDAKKIGLEGCYLKFRSTMEPYEDYLGPVEVIACGYRKLNQKEKEAYQKDEEVRTLAEDMGIPEYQARVVYELREKGRL